MPPNSPTNAPNCGFVSVLASVSGEGILPHMGRVWARCGSESDVIHFFGFALPEWIRTDSLRRPTGVFHTILLILFNHSLISFFVALCDPFEYTFRRRKKSPEDLTDFGKALRALSIFSLFYPGVRVHFPRKSWCEFNKNQIIRIVASITRSCNK